MDITKGWSWEGEREDRVWKRLLFREPVPMYMSAIHRMKSLSVRQRLVLYLTWKMEIIRLRALLLRRQWILGLQRLPRELALTREMPKESRLIIILMET